jgi:TolB-like protein
MTEPSRAVFLSYASQDAEAARRVCQALQSGGVEVWFDQSELRGGDAWDLQIRKQIHDCALFIPIISGTTQGRIEGYFRREWRLAVDRTHDMSERATFLVPVVIDDTGDAQADVPEAFRVVHWTRLPAGDTPPAFVARIAQLLAPSGSQVPAQTRLLDRPAPYALVATSRPVISRQAKLLSRLIAAIAILGIGYVGLDKFVMSRYRTGTGTADPATTAAGDSAPSAIPEQSIAVLPFVNMSPDKDQEYFSDGLTEEMIDLLGEVPDLRVPARTSSFYFKGKNEPIANIARQLRVAHVLEGSVRKAGKRLRITAQLIRADNGYHLWSQSYDRDGADVFAVQDDIAKAVVSALRMKLAATTPVVAARGTTNTEAYNQYLLGRDFFRRGSLEDLRHSVEVYRKAVMLDPDYAAAYSALGLAEAYVTDLTAEVDGFKRARYDVDKAIALAPNDANGYAARTALRSNWLWDWSGAQTDIEKALILDPRNADVQVGYASLLEALGRLPEAIAALKKATCSATI